MKFCRKFQVLNRQRRRYQQNLIIILSVFSISLTGFSFFNEISHVYQDRRIYSNIFLSSTGKCRCSKTALITFSHGECFFDQLTCYPGFVGNDCQIPVKNESYRSHCPYNIRTIQWTPLLIQEIKNHCLASDIAQQAWNRSCLFLCFYHRLTGITHVPEIFWHKSIKQELNYWKDNPMAIDDRLYEHVEGFYGYKFIPSELSSIIEIGAGPFTQVQYLLTPFRFIKEITLVEPNAIDYMKMNNCAYRGGYLRGYPISIIAESIERLMRKRRENMINSNKTKQYSAVMSINVVEHVHDALEYFRGLYDLLEDNGLLIFHERWYDYPQQGDCLLDSAENLHPIRITRWIIDKFLEQFQSIYVNFNRTKRQIHSPCFEQGVYFIGRKKLICTKA